MDCGQSFDWWRKSQKEKKKSPCEVYSLELEDKGRMRNNREEGWLEKKMIEAVVMMMSLDFC